MGSDGLTCRAPRILLPFISPEISFSSSSLHYYYFFAISNHTQNLQTNQPSHSKQMQQRYSSISLYDKLHRVEWKKERKGGRGKPGRHQRNHSGNTHTLSLAHTHIPTVKLGGLHNILCCYSNSAPSHGSWGQMLLFCEPMHYNFHLSLFLSRKYTPRLRGFVERKKVGGGGEEKT